MSGCRVRVTAVVALQRRSAELWEYLHAAGPRTLDEVDLQFPKVGRKALNLALLSLKKRGIVEQIPGRIVPGPSWDKRWEHSGETAGRIIARIVADTHAESVTALAERLGKSRQAIESSLNGLVARGILVKMPAMWAACGEREA